MQMRRFQVLIEWDADESLWVTTVPALDGLSTYGDTREEALDQTREAIAGYFEALEREGIAETEPRRPVELIDLDVAIA